MVVSKDNELSLKYLNKLRSDAAKTYGIPEYEVHVGHATLQALAGYPNFVAQIDAVTNASTTFHTIRRDAIRLSLGISKAGFKTGDVALIAVPNLPQTCLTIYMGFINGLPILPLDPASTHIEVDHYISLAEPKIIFCVKSNEKMFRDVLKTKSFNPTLISLDDADGDIEAFIRKHQVSDWEVDSFEPPRFGLSTPAWLPATSGTTGAPKLAIMSHENVYFNLRFFFYYFKKYPKPTDRFLVLSTPQWVSTLSLYCGSALYVITRIQTRATMTLEKCRGVFERYKPTYIMTSPTKLLELLNGGCDMSSLEYAVVGGSPLNETVDREFKKSRSTNYLPVYGMTELLGICFESNYDGPPLNVGKCFSIGFKYRFVDHVTGEIVTEPNVPAELWVKGESAFEGYYKNPEETAKVFSEDGYIKTGDLFYRNEDGYHFFVERLKMLLKFNNHHVYPNEIEKVLRLHGDVADAAVTGVRDPECGYLPIALVIRKEGATVTARELRELVAQKLSDPKHLRGGVVFVDGFPLTPSFKVDRTKLGHVISMGTVEY